MPEQRIERDYHAAVDSVLGALANYRRRAVVRELLAHPDETLEVETLGALVAERENGARGHGRPKRRNVVASLLHVHLPKLVEARIVAYDRDAGTVRCRENVFAEDILEVVDEVDETTDP